MGLDMYLIKKKKGEQPDKGEFNEVVYWRKANQIHSWFVDNVQGGEDDCGYYEVTKEQIEELLTLCRMLMNKAEIETTQIETLANKNGEWVKVFETGRVIVNKEVASEILPTRGGFFFGKTEYDEWYLRDIEKTIDELEKLLNEFDFDNSYLVYTSSW